MNNTELEYRGKLSIEKVPSLVEKITSHYSLTDFHIHKALTLFSQGIIDVRIKFRSGIPYLVFKKTVGKEASSEEKIEIDEAFEIEQLYNFLSFLKKLGVNDFIISEVTSFHFVIGRYELSMKLGAEIGEFWELDTVLTNQEESNIAAFRSEMEEILQTLTLIPWTKEEYSEVRNASKHNYIKVAYSSKYAWNDVMKRITTYLYEVRSISNINSLQTKQKRRLIDQLQDIDNDYTAIENTYALLSKTTFLKKRPLSSKKRKVLIKLVEHMHYSVIIPFLNDTTRISYCMEAINTQSTIAYKHYPNEIIIVDDGSTQEEKENVNRIINSYKHLPITVVQTSTNLGRSNARNIGADASTGEILFFLDSDTLISEDYILTHLLIHTIEPKVITVSMKENISIYDERLHRLTHHLPIEVDNIYPTDHRIQKMVDPAWKGVHPSPNVAMEVSCLEQTNNFKEFGKGRVVGVWSLPTMVITHNTVISKDGFYNIGRFSKNFKGWGLEDTYLGALLISQGYYVIPVLSTPVMHINHPVREVSQQQKNKDYIKNIEVYNSLMNIFI